MARTSTRRIPVAQEFVRLGFGDAIDDSAPFYSHEFVTQELTTIEAQQVIPVLKRYMMRDAASREPISQSWIGLVSGRHPPTQMRKRVLLPLGLLAIPALSWAFFKPIRVLAPALAGATCEGNICVDDPARLGQAQAIYGDALAFVDQSVGQIHAPPRMVFCSTGDCSRRFGFTNNGAYTVGLSGIVISHRGWTPYFARHELIHHLQNERLGVFGAWLGRPTWWREGMAYSLSLDERKSLPEPLQSYRSRFDQWLAKVGPERLWTAAPGSDPDAPAVR